MTAQPLTGAKTNPYSTILFTPNSVESQVQKIIEKTRSEIAENDSKKSKKKCKFTLSSYVSTFLEKPEIKNINLNNNNESFSNSSFASAHVSRNNSVVFSDDNDEIKTRHLSSFSSVPEFGDQLIIKDMEKPPPKELPARPISTPLKRQLPVGPDPSSFIKQLPEKSLLPPRLWGKNSKQQSSSSEYEEILPPASQTPKPQQVQPVVQSNSLRPRKRGRPRKHPLPENNYPSKSKKASDSSEYFPSKPNPPQTNEKEIFQDDHEEEAKLSDDTDSNEESENESEKIMVPGPRSPKKINEFPDCDIDEICGMKKDKSEYYVKYKGKSYNDLKWVRKDKILGNSNSEKTLKIFESYGIPTHMPYFNPLFIEPERILDMNGNSYLVKWTGLSYKYSTWEPKFENDELMKNYNMLKNPPEQNQPEQYTPINISEQFSLDDLQDKVVDRLYKKFCNKKDSNLYGTIGSILRLEIAALLYVLNERHHIMGPHLLVVSPTILELAANEMSVYTNLTVLKIPDGDDEEFNYIKNNAFLFSDKTPKFNIVVISSDQYQKFIEEFPQIHYIIAAIDTSEILSIDSSLSLSFIDASTRIAVKKRTDKEKKMDSQDDSTFLHNELTIFCPMLKAQKENYQSVIKENIDILTTPQNEIDMSRLYEVTTKLSALANMPAMLNSQDDVFRGSTPSINKKRFGDCGKMRVISEIIHYAQNNDKRLMIMCREQIAIDTLQLYATAYDIPFVRVGVLGTKRMKLDDYSHEAKSNKKIIVLALFGKQSINWLPLMLDIIIVFDGVYNPMYYFQHATRRPKKRDCLIIRLLTENSHEAYVASCADHYDEVPMYDLFKAAALTFMPPLRKKIIMDSKWPINWRFDAVFKEMQTSFQYIFDEDFQKQSKASSDYMSLKKNNNQSESTHSSSRNKESTSKSETHHASLSEETSKKHQNHSNVDHVKDLELSKPESHSKDTISPQKQNGNITNTGHTTKNKHKNNNSISNNNGSSTSSSKSQKQISTEKDSSSTSQHKELPSSKHNESENLLSSTEESESSNEIPTSHSLKASKQDNSHQEKGHALKQAQEKKIIKKETNIETKPSNSHKKRVLKRKYRLDPGQEIPKAPEHGSISIHRHWHPRIANSSNQSQQNSNISLTDEYLNNSNVTFRFVEIPSQLPSFGKIDYVWSLEDLNKLYMLISRRPWGQWDLVSQLLDIPQLKSISKLCIKESVYRLIDEILISPNLGSSANFSLLRMIVSDYKFTYLKESPQLCERIPNFVSSILNDSHELQYHMKHINILLCVSIIMSASVDPPNDIPLLDMNYKDEILKISDKLLDVPPWWTIEDDKQLIWFVWENGFFLSYDPEIWSGKQYVSQSILSHRLFLISQIIEKQLINKTNSFVFPKLIKEHPISSYELDTIKNASNSRLGSIARNYGIPDLYEFDNSDDFKNLPDVFQTFNNINQSVDVIPIIDIFEALKIELSYKEYYYAEDYQMMDFLEYYGIEQSNKSNLILSSLQTLNFSDIDPEKVFTKDTFSYIIKNLMKQKRSTPFDSTNTTYNTLGKASPNFPLQISKNIIINHIGEISNIPLFHNENYVYPIGYEAVTKFPSIFESSDSVQEEYICKIINNDGKPSFQVTFKSNPTISFFGETPEIVWGQIAEKAFQVNSNIFGSNSDIPYFHKINGHELFGLAFPITLRIIQAQNGCDQLTKYKLKSFKTPINQIVQNYKFTELA